MAARAKILVLIIICCLFVNCAYADVTVPKDTTVIPEQAFYGDRSLTEVELQEGLVRIESQAFANTSLTSVLLPRSLEYFAKDAFEGCPDDLEIRVYARSAAEELCNRYRLPHTTVSLGKIGISMPTTAFMRWVNDGHSLKGALEYAGYETDLEFADNNVDTQIAQVNAMIDDGCNVLIIAPVLGDAFTQVLAKAASRNVSVICYDRLLTDSENVDYYVSFSNEAVGALQANYILQALNVNGTSRSYTLEITAGDPQDTTGRKFYDGAMSVLQPYISSGRLVVKSGQTSFTSVATPGWRTDNAQARAAEILENYYSDGTVLDAWLCVNDSTALGVTNALVSSYRGQSWPVITGQDCDLANVRNILAGTQSMSVFKDTGILVDRTVQMAIQILEGEEVEVNATVANNRRNIPAYLCNPIYVDINNYYEVLIDGWYYTEDQLQGGTPVPSAVKIGVSMPTDALMRWQQDGQNLKTALKAYGYEVGLEYASNSVPIQLAQVDAMIDNGCKVLIIAPIDAGSFTEVLAKAASNNVAVISFDRLLTDENVDYYVSFSNEAVGAVQANYILQALNVNGTSGSYTLEITAGDKDDINGRKFYDGAMSVLQPYINSGRLTVKSGQTELSSVATSAWRTETARARAEEILENYYSDGTDLDAWLCINDSTALGVTNALVNSYCGESWPVITGQDCDLANVRNILAGTQSMSVFKDTRALVYRAVDMTVEILDGLEVTVNGTVDNSTKNVPAYLCDPIYVDKTNYREVLVDSGYYTEAQLQGGTPLPSHLRVGISMPTDELLRWQLDGQRLKAALNASGHQVDLKFASNDVSTQIAQVDAMIDSGCKVLIILPADVSAFSDVLAKAASNNVIVISYDRLLMDTENVDYYVHFNYYSVGTLQGSYIRDALGLEDPNTAGPFTLEITAGDPMDYNGELFYQGGMAVLQPYITSGKLVVRSDETSFAATSTENWNTSAAEERAGRILSGYYPDMDLDAWFCCNDSLASGVIGALFSLDYSGSWPVITGLDCDYENVRYIRDGWQSMSVFFDSRLLVSRTAELTDQLLRTGAAGSPDTAISNNTKPVPTFQCTPVLVDRTNYEELLIGSGLYTYEDLE